jgi:hypothetical protein
MLDTTTNLPPATGSDSAEEVRNFFDKYFLHQITFPTNQIDAIVGFFLKRGFDDNAARSTAIVLLNQARLENVSPFKLLDTIKGLTSAQLSNVVTEVLNVYRDRSSSLGFKLTTIEDTAESRNIRQ